MQAGKEQLAGRGGAEAGKEGRQNGQAGDMRAHTMYGQHQNVYIIRAVGACNHD
jgi:hypothetical protein